MIDAPPRKLSQRAMDAAPSPTLAITAKANALKAEGKDVISFGAGEPDFDTPQNVKDAAVKAIAAGDTKYTVSSGTVALKDAIIAKLSRDNDLTYTRSEIIASAGAKHSIYNAFQALLQKDDEVVIPAPYWVSYPEQVKLAGAAPVIVPTGEDFLTTVEDVAAHLTPRTKMIVLNTPSNPTGAVYDNATLERFAALAVSRGIYILSDEIYEKVVYDGRKLRSIASYGSEVKKLTITVNGLSKSHSMTGWRLGYAAADAEIVSAMGRIQDQSTSNPTSITQAAAVEALNGPQDTVETMRVEFEKRRNFIVAALNRIPGVRCSMPGGAFYVFPNISGLYGRCYPSTGGEKKTIRSGDDLTDYLLETTLVAVVPGSGFGTPDYVRLSYATSMANIERGVGRIAEAVERLR